MLSEHAMIECQRLRKIVDPYVTQYVYGVTRVDPEVERASKAFSCLALVMIACDRLAIGDGEQRELEQELRIRMASCHRLIKHHQVLRFQFEGFERKFYCGGFSATNI
jgi:hypothetical protein